jgi:hypothetical protein
MIHKFNLFNESLLDKMQPKELSGDAKLIYDAQEDIKSIGLRTSKLESEKGVYSFRITNISDLELNIYYNGESMKDYYTDEFIKTQPIGWHVYVNDNRGKNKKERIVAESWDDMVVDIIDICYPNTSSIIRNVEEAKIEEWQNLIDMNNKLLVGLNKAKEIKRNYYKK